MTPEQIAAKLIPSKSILNRHESCQTVAELRERAAAVIREVFEPLEAENERLRSENAKLKANWMAEQKARIENADFIQLWTGTKAKAEVERQQREIDDLRSQRDAAIRELERLSDDLELGPVPQGERKTINVKYKQAGRIEPLPYPEDE